MLIKLETHSFYGFKVLFDEPVVIEKGVNYRIEAAISGANSCFGKNGQISVVCSGVKFYFQDSTWSRNGTKVGQGQFPSFIFKEI